jgi:Ca2+-dependent lipid-binding protein
MMQQNLESSSISSSNSLLTNSSQTTNGSTLSEHLTLNGANNNASYRRVSTLSNTTPIATTSSSNPTTTSTTTTFQQIRVNIKGARFTPNGGIFNTKGDIYVEMIIDGHPSRKTEIARKTWSPVWDEKFDILVTPLSRM